MSRHKLGQALLYLLFLSVVLISTFVLLRWQLAPLLQELGGTGLAPGQAPMPASPPSIAPPITLPPLTFALVATVPATPTVAIPTQQAPQRSPPVLAPTPTSRVGIVNSPVVNVRSYPSLAGEVIGQAQQGDRLTILAISPDGQWLQVCCPLGTDAGTRQSWVAADLISLQP
jgi:hypothetical protein